MQQKLTPFLVIAGVFLYSAQAKGQTNENIINNKILQSAPASLMPVNGKVPEPDRQFFIENKGQWPEKV